MAQVITEYVAISDAAHFDDLAQTETPDVVAILKAYEHNIQCQLPEGVTFKARLDRCGHANREAYRELEAHGVDVYARQSAYEAAL